MANVMAAEVLDHVAVVLLSASLLHEWIFWRTRHKSNDITTIGLLLHRINNTSYVNSYVCRLFSQYFVVELILVS